MISKETKHKLIQELEKSGNVYLSCLKLGIDKATYYRWREKNKKFKEQSDKAVSRGRENNCDVAEHALMLKVKEKDMGAIKYVLSHNSNTYKQSRTSYSTIEHKNPTRLLELKEKNPISFTEMIWGETEWHHLKTKEIMKLFPDGKLPNKPDGTPINEKEVVEYEEYLRNWVEHERKIKLPESKTIIDKITSGRWKDAVRRSDVSHLISTLEQEFSGKDIPTKSNGEEIRREELPIYADYIRAYLKMIKEEKEYREIQEKKDEESEINNI